MMIVRFCAGGVLLFLLLGCQPGRQVVQYGDRDPCLQEAQTAASEIGISSADITSIDMIEVIGGGREVGPFVTGVEAWLKTSRCQSSIVIKLDNLCGFRSAYGRGDCRLPSS